MKEQFRTKAQLELTSPLTLDEMQGLLNDLKTAMPQDTPKPAKVRYEAPQLPSGFQEQVKDDAQRESVHNERREAEIRDNPPEPDEQAKLIAAAKQALRIAVEDFVENIGSIAATVPEPAELA